MKTIAFLLFSCFLITTNAQNTGTESQRKFQYQVGLDVTTFIKEFAVPNNIASTNANPYLFNAKALYHIDDKLMAGLRVGLWYKNNRDAAFNVLSNTESTTQDNNLNFRYGLELQQHLTGRWTAYYGLDFIYGNEESTTISSFSNGSNIIKQTTKDNKHTTGAGPVLGIQFRINKHLCLGTELSLYFTQYNGGTKTTSSDPLNPTLSDITRNGRASNIIVPGFINLNIIL